MGVVLLNGCPSPLPRTVYQNLVSEVMGILTDATCRLFASFVRAAVKEGKYESSIDDFTQVVNEGVKLLLKLKED